MCYLGQKMKSNILEIDLRYDGELYFKKEDKTRNENYLYTHIIIYIKKDEKYMCVSSRVA